jgi:hypothetical protein
MHKILRDPLIHFLVLGAALFTAYSMLNPAEDLATSNQIRITKGDIERFEQIYRKLWRRTPTQEELQGLINAHVKEEVFYREALAMGLEKDDTIVRRRLAQKVEFLIADVTLPSDVDDRDLVAFYENNTSRYSRAATLTFRHIYFNQDQRGERTFDEANATLQTLQATKADSEIEADLGDRFLLQTRYQQKTTDVITRDFGREFTEKLATLEPGAWQGPVRSAYGLHLVFIDERQAAGSYPFAEVREQVRNDYLFELRKSQNEAVLAKLKSRYEIVIEQD